MKNYPNPIWTTANNERKRLKTLTNLHLINCRRWLDTAGADLEDSWNHFTGDYTKDGLTLAEWRDVLDDEIARRVMESAEDRPLCL